MAVRTSPGRLDTFVIICFVEKNLLLLLRLFIIIVSFQAKKKYAGNRMKLYFHSIEKFLHVRVLILISVSKQWNTVNSLKTILHFNERESICI